MPWKVFKEGSQFCVHKLNTDGSKGAKVGCHPTKDAALKQQKALYANEPKASAMEPYVGEDGLWRIDRVPIVSTGIEYRLSTGKTTFTEADLADAVKAQGDPAIVQPRIKLGHSDQANDLLLGDGEPAFGRVEGMVLDDNGHTIYGDYVGTPEWLASVLPVAYPSRSIEGTRDVETVTGKEYKLVITDVSLLGVKWPGCSVLEDLPLWYGADVPEAAEIETDTVAAKEGGMRFKRNKEVSAEIDVSDVRRTFYTDVAQDDAYWWWIRAERVTDDGLSLIVDNDKGGLYRYDVSVDGDEIEFSDPVEVTVKYPEKTAAVAAAVVAGMAVAQEGMTIHASRDETRPEDMPTLQKGGSMDEKRRLALAAALGLPEEATPEQIRAEVAVQEAAAPPVDPDAKPDDDQEDENKVAPVPTPDDENDPNVLVPDDEAATVTLDRATFNRLKQGADVALASAAEAGKRAISDLVKAKIEDGTIPPARRDHWLRAAQADFDGVKATLDSMEPGLIPVNERGSGGGGDGGTDLGVSAGLPDEWFPELSVIRAQAAQHRPVVQAKEG
jgi:hypothetical protein